MPERRNIKRICKECGRPFWARKSDIARGWGNYCSLSCSGKVGRRTRGYQVGPDNPKWRGGRVKHSKGYIMVYAPNHPNAGADGYVMEHRLVMEMHLNRWLRPDEVVHHIDGDVTNNAVENLEVLTNAEHSALHNKLRKAQ